MINKKKFCFKTLLLSAFLGFLLLTAVGCGGDKGDIKKVIKEHVNALNKGDIVGAMSYISKDSPSYEETGEKVKKLLEDYELNYKIEKITIMKLEDSLQKKKKKKTEDKDKKKEEEIEKGLVEEDFMMTDEEKKAKEEKDKKKQAMERRKNPPKAVVKVIQLTEQRGKSGAHKFLDNKATLIHTLIKENREKWKIVSTIVSGVEYIPKTKD